MAFDLLHLNGDDLTSKPLIERRERLQRVKPAGGDALIVLNQDRSFSGLAGMISPMDWTR